MSDLSKPVAQVLAALAVLAGFTTIQAQDRVKGNDPRSVVSRCLELRRSGNRDEARALATGDLVLRPLFLTSSREAESVRVEQSLGSDRVAAVVTTSLKNKEKQVLLFWLKKRDDDWRVYKTEAVSRAVADDRLLGFLEAGDIHWHVRVDDVLGQWEAGPGYLPFSHGIFCGSRLQFDVDKSFHLVGWGPGGPPEEDDGDEGKWRLESDRIILSLDARIHVCQIKWVAGNKLILEPIGGKGDSEFERLDVAWDAPLFDSK